MQMKEKKTELNQKTLLENVVSPSMPSLSHFVSTLVQKFVDTHTHTILCTYRQLDSTADGMALSMTNRGRQIARQTDKEKQSSEKRTTLKSVGNHSHQHTWSWHGELFREKSPSVSQFSKAALPLLFLFRSLFSPLCLFVTVQLGCMSCNPGSLYFFY